jgi:hypothetical protein
VGDVLGQAAHVSLPGVRLLSDVVRQHRCHQDLLLDFGEAVVPGIGEDGQQGEKNIDLDEAVLEEGLLPSTMLRVNSAALLRELRLPPAGVHPRRSPREQLGTVGHAVSSCSCSCSCSGGGTRARQSVRPRRPRISSFCSSAVFMRENPIPFVLGEHRHP